MDRSSFLSPSAAHPIHGRRRIGFIGIPSLDPYEEGVLYHIGRCIARLGHTVITTAPNKGNTSLRKGIEREKGLVETVAKDVIGSSDHTLVYKNDHLHQRLREKYEDIDDRQDVLLLSSETIDDWHDAVIEVLRERGVGVPTHGETRLID